jgi:hypothetical protein
MKNSTRNTQYAILITLILAWLVLPQTSQAAAPVANDQALTINEDTSKNITLTASDADGDSLTYFVVTKPAHGSLSNLEAGTNKVLAQPIKYTPSANYNGADSFTFKANDGTSDSNIATVSFTINPIDDAPQLTQRDLVFAIKPEENSVSKTYLLRFLVTEVDGNTLTYAAQNLPSFAHLDPNTGELTLSITHSNINTYPNIIFTVTDVTPAGLSATKTVNLIIREAKTYYCDPNGNTQTGHGSSESPWGTLQSVVEAGLFNGVKIISGDTLRLRTGFHGIFNLDSGAPSGTIKKNTDYITIEADTPALADLSFIWLYNCEYWHFKGLRISPSFSNQVSESAKSDTGGNIIHDIYNSKYIIIEDCNIFTTLADVSGWDPNDWKKFAYRGILFTSMSYCTIHGNFIHIVGDGINACGSTANPGSYDLIEQNVIDSYGDDGIQTTCAHSIIQDNIITNKYKMLWYIKADGQPEYTHGDAIQFNQLLPSSALAIHDVIIRRNYTCSRTDPNRSIGTLYPYDQGFFLDGLADGVIENNVILCGAYLAGLSINSYASNVRIVNNTVLRPYGFPSGSRPAIMLPRGTTDWGARNVIVRNNIANPEGYPVYGFPYDSNTVPSPHSTYYENVDVDHNFNISNYNPFVEFVDYVHGNVRLANGSRFIDTGSSLDAPAEDLERNSRPQGQGYDVGAYEYGASTFLYGDVNGDGEISAYDAALTAQVAVDLITLTPEQTKAADVNSDREVTAYDAALIAQRAVGLIDKFPVE